MKRLKFIEELIPLILSGEKTTTWRLFDDKNLSSGDELELVNSQTGETFANAKIIDVYEKPIKDVDQKDREGHEKVGTGKELLKHYETLYNKHISPDEMLKVIKFKLI